MRALSIKSIRAHGVRFAHDTRGTAALEFAFVLPLVCAIVFVTYELVQMVRAGMQVSTAATSIADMVAQQSSGLTSGSTGSIGDFCRAAQWTMLPLPTGTASGAGAFAVSVASVTNYSGTGPKVDWESDRSCKAAGQRLGATAIKLATGPIDLIPNAGTPGDSIIVVRVTYRYQSALRYLLQGNQLLTKTALARPRGNQPIACAAPCS
jgi:Flp pilus assembly protein TadG